MNDLFGRRAAEFAGLAARRLGWRPDEFWASTPTDLVLALQEPQTLSGGLSRSELNVLLESDHNG